MQSINPNPNISVLWERICICSSLICSGVDPLLAKMISDQAYEDALHFWKQSKVAGDPSYRLRRMTNRLLKEYSIDTLIDVDSQNVLRLLGLIVHPALTEESRLSLLIFLGTPTSFQNVEHLPQRQWRLQFELGAKVLIQGWHRHDEAHLDEICASLMIFYHFAGKVGGKSYRDFTRQICSMLFYTYPEVACVLALQSWVTFRKAREPARTLSSSLKSEDRRLWNLDDIKQAKKYLRLIPKQYKSICSLYARIEHCYVNADSWETTDWKKMVWLYEQLEVLEPTLSVLTHYAESIYMLHGPEAALAMLESREYSVSDPSWLALRGELLYKMGRPLEGLCTFQRALRLSSGAIRHDLLNKMASCQQAPASFLA
jgi:hypothetical protein